MTFAVDIDGVIFERGAYPEVGPANWDILNALVKLRKAGHKVYMFTARTGGALWLIEDRLKEIDSFEFDKYPHPEDQKVRADFYVDDRMIQPSTLPRIVETFLQGKTVEDRRSKDDECKSD